MFTIIYKADVLFNIPIFKQKKVRTIKETVEYLLKNALEMRDIQHLVFIIVIVAVFINLILHLNSKNTHHSKKNY